MDISIIITNYNRSSLLSRAIRSCLNQVVTNTQLEIVLVDDCSTDSSCNVWAEFSKDIKVYRNKVNRGVGYCSKKGVELSTGEYIMRVDSDDFISPFTCTILKSALDANQASDFAVCDHVRVDSNGRKQKIVKLDNRDAILKHGAGILFRSNLFENFGNYRHDLRHGEDYELISRFMKKGAKSIHIPIPLYRYYINDDNLTLLKEHNDLVKKIKSGLDYNPDI